jgi:hypothetical protein
MPFKSDSQRKLFYAVANNKKVANKVNMNQDMAKKFIEDAQNDVKPKKPRFKKLNDIFGKKD